MGIYIALTGGIAAGKSTVASRLKECGATIIDADQLARAVVAPGSEPLTEIGRAFGDAVLREDGGLDRSALAALVFGDEQRLRTLNSIVHPAIRERVEAERRAAFAESADAVVVYDIPLLSPEEANGYDAIVVVAAPEAQRVQRLVSERGMTLDEARRRIDSQPLADRILAVADVVISSSVSVDDTRRQADDLWRRLRERAGGGAK